MPTHQLEAQISELRRTAMDLYERAEQWRKALVEIDRFNRDPVIKQIIKQNLNQ